MKNRTVFDTNIWISYMIAAKYDELEAMLANNVHFLRSAPSLIELQDVLSPSQKQNSKTYYINSIQGKNKTSVIATKDQPPTTRTKQAQ